MTIALIILFFALQIGDVVTSAIALDRPGNYEANKFVAWLMRRVGVVPGLLVVKLLIVPIAVAWLYLDAALRVVVLVVLNLFYVWVLVNNIKHLRD